MRRISGAGFIMLLAVISSALIAGSAVAATGPLSAARFTPTTTAELNSIPEPPPIADAPPSELMVEAGSNGASSSAELEEEPEVAPAGSLSPEALSSPLAQPASGGQQADGIEYTGPLPVPFEGGYIQRRPHVFLIFWGSEWNGIPGTKEKLIGLYRALSGSSYAHILTQYFDYSGYFSGETDLTSITDSRVAAPPPAYPADIRGEVEAMIAAHPEWGPANYENQYVIVTPPGTPSTFPQGCGYHGWQGYSYTYVPWSTPDCLRGLQPWGAMQVSLSHEWAESATDPIPTGEYWGWDAQQIQGEIGDVCNTATPAEQTTVTEGIYGAKLGDDYLWKANGTLCVGHDQEADRFTWGTGGWSVTEPHSVSINGSINPAGEPAYYDWEVNGPGGTQNIPQRCANPTEKHFCFAYAGEAFSSGPVLLTLTGLKGETTYSYQLNVMGKLTEGPPVIEYYGQNHIMPGGVNQFTTPAWRPVVSNLYAEEAGKMTATFHATISGLGTPTHYHFEYGTEPGQLNQTVPIPDAQIGSAPAAVSQTATNVEGTIYYRVAATNEEGTTYSPQSSVYIKQRPTVQMQLPENVVGGHVTLRGWVIAHQLATTYYFEYGPGHASGGTRTPELTDPSQGSDGETFFHEVDGLVAGTVYRGRLVATNWVGTTFSQEVAFTAGWAQQEVARPADAANGEFSVEGASCTSQAFCMAVAHYENTSKERDAVGEEWNGSEWEVRPIPIPVGAGAFDLRGSSCRSSGSCEAVGFTNPLKGIYSEGPVAAAWDGAKWQSQILPLGPGLAGTVLNDVSCPISAFCMATGAGVSSTAMEPEAYSFNGSSWQVGSVPRPAGMNHTMMNGISCTSASFCIAVGGTEDVNGSSSVAAHPVAEVWNGSRWSLELPPVPAGANPMSELNDISCVATTWCEAVGQYRGPQGTYVGYAAHRNGSTWTNEMVPPSNEGLDGVSCAAQGSCQAVGRGAGKDRLSSGAWEEEPDPSAGRFQGVSCSSTAFCLAVGVEPTTGPIVESLAQTPLAKLSQLSAKQVGESSAEIVGQVNPDDSTTKVRFEYGTGTSYGSATPELNAGSGVAPVEEHQSISGLQPGTLYHYRMVATNAGGTTTSKDQTFVTSSAYAGPLNVLPVTDPFNGTTSAISNFKEKWTALPWDGTASPKGEDRSTGWGPVEAFPSIAGASYGPTATDLGTGSAIEATMGANPGVTGGYFSVWLDMPSAPTVKAGYQLKFYDSATNKYTVSLIRWSGGTPTTLKEATNVSFVNGNALALVDEGTTISAWTNTGSGFTRLIAASDSTYSSGTVAVESAGNATRLTGLKFGTLQGKAASMSAAIGGLRLDDSFATAESPLSEGGTWAALAWDNGSSGHNTGRVQGGWGPYDSFNTLNGAYWTTASFADTGSGTAVTATLAKGPELAEGRHFDLWLDMPNPGAARSGYELRFNEKVAGSYEVTLARYQTGTQSILASKSGVTFAQGGRLALSDKGGTLAVWTAGASGEYTQLLTATDTTFTAGYAGIAGAGNNTRLTNFRAGPLAPY